MMVREGEVHGNRGKSPPNAFSKEVRDHILELSREKYVGFNDTHFTEKLIEVEGIDISRETVRGLRRSHGIKPKNKRRPKRHYRRRARQEQEGMMVIWDGSPHRWFGVEYSPCCLMAAIDDATEDSLWRYETLTGLLLDKYGSIDDESGKGLVDYLHPPAYGYYGDDPNQPIGASRTLYDLSNLKLWSLYGNYNDPWVYYDLGSKLSGQ